MGETAEKLADLGDYSRDEMDAWGLLSQQRAQSSTENGFLARQIVPIEVPEGRKDTRIFSQDEFPRFGITAEKLARLKPAFRENGRVTAGNSSGITDGAASLIVADADALRESGVTAEAEWIDSVVVGVPPEIMGSGPVPAIDALLKKHDLSVDDIDYFEINEAFAVVNVHAEHKLGIPKDRTNLHGGGISIGHPPGATGIRMTITAMHQLADMKGTYGIISMCLGGGQGMATLIKNI